MTLERDYKRFIELMQYASELTVLPNGKDIGKMSLAFFKELASYPFEAVQAAVEAHCREEKFFPMLADIVTRIEGRSEDRAAAAWALVLKAISRYGRVDSVRFPDPAIHYAISQMGGWRNLCQTLMTEEIPFRGKDFAGYFSMGERLASWEAAPGKVRVPAYLIGEHEISNRAQGYALRKVWDVSTGRIIPETDLPALQAPQDQVAPIIELMAHGMKAREAV